MEEILAIINNLENKQSFIDPMPCKQFKICQSELIPVFQKLINASFDSGYFPDCLKLAIVTPILKSVKLDREIISNYRPISTLTIISKIFENCILSKL